MNEASTPQRDEGVWDRLRRRKVVQWSVAYVAAAWALLQGLQFLADIYGWPLQVLRLITLVLALGLPIVLVLAWYHGDRGEQRIRGTELAIISLLFLVGGGVFWLYDRGREDDAEPVTAQDAAPAASPDTPVPAPDAKSIAVLPFADMSPAKDQEYMSDGIAEELLNLLAKVPDLKVTARTSSFAFKGKNLEIAEIAKRLNVAHVLEGSVRKSGNTVRITAQLIRTSDSTHLWSERYDRPLDDIFAVQDEISNAIVQALQIHLMRGTLSGRQGGTQNPEAYELYLRAWNGEDRDNAPSLDAAERYLQRAIDLDPEFSVAWSALATVTLVKVENGYLDTKEGFERIRHLTQHALQLNPNNAHAHSLLAGIYMAYDRDWPAAEVEVQRALTLDPTNPDSLNDAGRLSAARGRWDDAERQFRAALVRDPVHDYVIFNLGLTYYRARRFADAEREFRELLEVEPGFPWTRGMLGLTLLLQGKTEAALAIVQQDVDEEMKLLTLPLALWAAGRHDEADQTLRAQIRHWGDRGAYYVALSYAHRDDRDRTLEWLQRAYEQGDPALFEMFGDPLFDSIADDPRFKAFLRKMKLPEWPQSSVAATGT